MTPPDGGREFAADDRLADLRADGRLERYLAVRAVTEALAGPLSAEDQTVQSMADASPVKWHRAHTSWFFETFLLIPSDPAYRPFDPLFGYLFNSYYEAVGPRQPRPSRGLLTRPSLERVRAYRRHVDDAMTALLRGGLDAEAARLLELGLAHEQQHQELILTDVLHLFGQIPGWPAYRALCARPQADPGPARFLDFDGGQVWIGHDGDGFAFDNETPRHPVLLQPYRLADRLTTNGEWLAFMEDGGYLRPQLWLSDGWARAGQEGWSHPLYWTRTEDGWAEMSLGGLRPLQLHAPVSHVSYYEADAYARWAGKRLPDEAEWEHAAAAADPGCGYLDLDRLAPNCAGSGPGLRQMFGELWQWTRSAYGPYPGFSPGAGAVGEYNGKFMVNQQVLRGGACVTPAGHLRASYRNFFYPHQRWMFSGVRLAEDGPRRSRSPRRDAFARDVLEGLGATPKRLSSKYFYDAAGSALFEAICALPEYYLTRTETALLRDAAASIAAHIPAGAAIVEFGSGASVKTRLLLDAAPQAGAYVPIDISDKALAQAASAMSADYPQLTVAALVGDFTQPIALPAAARERPRVGFFPGSTIGNFHPAQAVEFLRAARRLLGDGSQFIVGADLVKSEAVLLAAYDDAQGVTAAFNLNLLTRINRELDGDINLALFGHRAVWNADERRIEMHLAARIDQTFEVAGRRVRMAAGETIHTENSYKFTAEGFAELAAEAGWTLGAQWISADPGFAVFLLEDRG